MEIKRKQVNGLNFSLFNEKDEKVFEGVYKQVKHLENYITNISIITSFEIAVVEFKRQFEVEFDINTYKVKAVKTTFSNQVVDDDFIKLASKLYELKGDE